MRALLSLCIHASALIFAHTAYSRCARSALACSVGHKGKFGHEFMEFEFRGDGKLRYANNSNYKKDSIIRKEGAAQRCVVNCLLVCVVCNHQLERSISRASHMHRSCSDATSFECSDRVTSSDRRAQAHCQRQRDRKVRTRASLQRSTSARVISRRANMCSRMTDACASREDDKDWPEPDRVGRQELELICDDKHISFTVQCCLQLRESSSR